MKKKVLVIVAHPDDELIWVGGTLIHNKSRWSTKVVCFTRASDKDRAPKFFKTCKALGVKGFIYDYDDTKQTPIPLKEYEKVLTKFSKPNYDLIFTHGSNGEYGHSRHKEIGKAVKTLLKQKLLKAKKVFFFSYKKKTNKNKGYAIYNSSADILIKLNRNEFLLKKHIIQNIYGYKKNGFEEKSCDKVESFKKLK